MYLALEFFYSVCFCIIGSVVILQTAFVSHLVAIACAVIFFYFYGPHLILVLRPVIILKAKIFPIVMPHQCYKFNTFYCILQQNIQVISNNHPFS